MGIASGEFPYADDLESDAKGRNFTDRKGKLLTNRLTDEAMKITEDAGSRPFYLNLWFYNAHTSIEAKPTILNTLRKNAPKDP